MGIGKFISHRKQFLALLVCLSMLAALGPLAPHLLHAQPPVGAIAYVRSNDDTGDEIRLIRPNGDGDRMIWSSNEPDPYGVHEIANLSWRPGSSELAFDSTHENWCSVNSADLFTVAVDGQGYRRVTEAPACAELAAYPQGRVEVPVRASLLSSFYGFVYFQGAPSMQLVSLAPGGKTTLVFENVADAGAGKLQIAAMIAGNYRTIATAAAVDVVAGATVRTSEITLYLAEGNDWWVYQPTWRRDGLKLGYVSNVNGLRQIDAQPPALALGDDLLAVERSAMTEYVYLLQLGPTPATENQLLYAGGPSYEAHGIYLATAGSANAGELLLSFDPYESVLGLAWLPDGSGFIYSVKEFDEYPLQAINLYEYRFATRQSTQLTDFAGQFAGKLSISPDGQQIVFELATAMENDFGSTLIDPDLWIMERDGSGMRLLVKNGRAPAWSQQEPHPPAPEPTTTPTQAATPVQTPVQTPVPPGDLQPELYLPLLQSLR